MAPRMAAVLRAPGKFCSFLYVLFSFFVVLRVICIYEVICTVVQFVFYFIF